MCHIKNNPYEASTKAIDEDDSSYVSNPKKKQRTEETSTVYNLSIKLSFEDLKKLPKEARLKGNRCRLVEDAFQQLAFDVANLLKWETCTTQKHQKNVFEFGKKSVRKDIKWKVGSKEF